MGRKRKAYGSQFENRLWTVAQSVSTWHPDVIVRRQNWIDYAGDQTRAAVA